MNCHFRLSWVRDSDVCDDGNSRSLETFLRFTPTLTNFVTERTKESGPTEKFLEKHKFCPKQPISWCKRGAKRKKKNESV
jgi:hypothetical protein